MTEATTLQVGDVFEMRLPVEVLTIENIPGGQAVRVRLLIGDERQFSALRPAPKISGLACALELVGLINSDTPAGKREVAEMRAPASLGADLHERIYGEYSTHLD